MATYHGVKDPGESQSDLKAVFEKLFGYPAPASLWESDILPARVRNYKSSFLDTLLADTELSWFLDAEAVRFASVSPPISIYISHHTLMISSR